MGVSANKRQQADRSEQINLNSKFQAIEGYPVGPYLTKEIQAEHGVTPQIQQLWVPV